MKSYNAKDTGVRIQEERKAMNLSREALADDINISVKYLGNIELGKQIMSSEILFNLSNVLNSSTDYLLGINLK